jgi:peptidoglycan/xylan/chitin deacetylase (PgdA/CDA1 family)
VARHPDLARAIVQAGHSIENHTHRHPLYFCLLGPARIRREIEDAQREIAAAAGEPARFFRAPAGFRNLLLDPVLTRLDLKLASWTRRGFDTVNAEPASVLKRLTRNLRGGDILLLHDGNAARSSNGQPVILEVLPPLLAALASAGLKPVTLRAAFE